MNEQPLLLRVLGIGIATVAMASCAPPEVTEPTATPTDRGIPIGEPVRAIVGAAGGAVITADGRFTLTIPAGALTTDTAIEVQPLTPTAPGGMVEAYELGPPGQTFALPVVLTRAFDAEADGTPLAWMTQDDDGYWIVAEGAELDAEAGTFSVETLHFSPWGVVTSGWIEIQSSAVDVGQRTRLVAHVCRTFGTMLGGTVGRSAFVHECDVADSVTWSVAGVVGGTATVGTISGPPGGGIYTAPTEVPSPATVVVTAAVTLAASSRLAAVSTTLTARIRIAPVGGTYRGLLEVVQEDGDVRATGQVTWTPQASVGSWEASGYLNTQVTRDGCDTANVRVPISPASELELFGPEDPISPSSYHFEVSGTLDFTAMCDDGSGMRVATPSSVSPYVGVGTCGMFPPYWPSTDPHHWMGMTSCSGVGTVSANWDFVVLE